MLFRIVEYDCGRCNVQTEGVAEGGGEESCESLQRKLMNLEMLMAQAGACKWQ